ncbi:MAG: P1 family peptidase [Actinomycetota bacterium]
MLTDVTGVAVGHWTDEVARTGCTVIVLPQGTVASGEVRGGAPASRELALLDPIRTVTTVDAVVLSGGSAFGLAAADGVMSALEAQGRGFETRVGVVPIVVGLSLFDLAVGDAAVRPGPAEGRLALDAASTEAHAVGRVGAGTGATVGKWSGEPQPGGIGAATRRAGPVTVSALIAVNAYGFVDDGRSVDDIGPPVRPEVEPDDDDDDGADLGQTAGAGSGSSSGETATNTTIGIVATNARLDKVGCHLLAQSAHDGLARSLLPAHTAADGDAIVAAATGEVDPAPDDPAGPIDLAHLRLLAQAAVAAAVRSVAD